jgi:hypothetical protein
MFFKSIIKNPTCFGHYFMTILKGRPLFLVHLPLFGCLLRNLLFGMCPYAVCNADGIRPLLQNILTSFSVLINVDVKVCFKITA